MPGDRSSQYGYEFGAFRLIVSERLLLRDGEPVPLPHRAFDTLLLLVQNQGQLLSKDDLLKRIWPDVVVGENSLAQVVSAIRKALGQQPHEHKFIETNPGRGYRFIARIRKVRERESDGAHQAYFKGRYYWNKRTEEGLKKGIRHFQQAIDLDPGYALAYAGLADSYSLLGMLDCLAPPETFPKAKTAALKALELDETLAEAYTSLA